MLPLDAELYPQQYAQIARLKALQHAKAGRPGGEARPGEKGVEREDQVGMELCAHACAGCALDVLVTADALDGWMTALLGYGEVCWRFLTVLHVTQTCSYTKQSTALVLSRPCAQDPLTDEAIDEQPSPSRRMEGGAGDIEARDGGVDQGDVAAMLAALRGVSTRSLPLLCTCPTCPTF